MRSLLVVAFLLCCAPMAKAEMYLPPGMVEVESCDDVRGAGYYRVWSSVRVNWSGVKYKAKTHAFARHPVRSLHGLVIMKPPKYLSVIGFAYAGR
jgi:hypothetical protein